MLWSGFLFIFNTYLIDFFLYRSVNTKNVSPVPSNWSGKEFKNANYLSFWSKETKQKLAQKSRIFSRLVGLKHPPSSLHFSQEWSSAGELIDFPDNLTMNPPFWRHHGCHQKEDAIFEEWDRWSVRNHQSFWGSNRWSHCSCWSGKWDFWERAIFYVIQVKSLKWIHFCFNQNITSYDLRDEVEAN